MLFARRAIVYLSSAHPPLQRAYFSTLASHKTLEKHRVSRLVYLFTHVDLPLLWLFLFSDLLPFSSLTLPTSAFPSVRFFVGSLTSKLPSTSLHSQIIQQIWKDYKVAFWCTAFRIFLLHSQVHLKQLAGTCKCRMMTWRSSGSEQA